MDGKIHKGRLSALRALSHSLNTFHSQTALTRVTVFSTALRPDGSRDLDAHDDLEWALALMKECGFAGEEISVTVEDIPHLPFEDGFSDFILRRKSALKGGEAFPLPRGGVEVMQAIRRGMFGKDHEEAWMLNAPSEEKMGRFLVYARGWLNVLKDKGVVPADWQVAERLYESGRKGYFVAGGDGKRLPFTPYEDPDL